ncbi:MAG: competence protein ComK [Bacillota bacterium]
MKELKVLITRRTVAIGPAYDGIHQSVMYDYSGRKTFSEKSVMEILEDSCMVYRSTYDGRIKAVRHATKYLRKTPLMVCPQEFIYAIPTIAPTDYDCIWLFCQHIESTVTSEGKTYIQFTNGEQLEINCSEKVITKQRERAAATMNHFVSFPSRSAMRRAESELYLPGFHPGMLDSADITNDSQIDF